MKPFKLDDIEKNKQPFAVPKGYFEDLPMKIQSKIEVKKKDSWTKNPAFKLAFSMAAMAAIIFSVFALFSDPQSPEDILANISQEELLAYVDLVQLEESDILNAFEDGAEGINFFDSDGFEDIEIGDEALDDLLLEYDLSEEYL